MMSHHPSAVRCQLIRQPEDLVPLIARHTVITESSQCQDRNRKRRDSNHSAVASKPLITTPVKITVRQGTAATDAAAPFPVGHFPRIPSHYDNMELGAYNKGSESQHLKSGAVMAREVNILVRAVLDLVCILIVGLPILILHLAGKPYQRGFNCDDETLMYPFKDSTITNVTLYIVGIFAPVITIVITEFIIFRNKAGKAPLERRIFFQWNIPPFFWEWYIKVGVFAFGACLSQMTTDIAKYSIGRLRPHFRDVCRPDINCSLPENANRYIDNFQCTTTNDFLNRESRLSFISGHSSFSAYTMVYIVLYLQARMTFRQVTLLRPFLQALALYAAWFTALSRISDYKHHWSDVLAGSLQGTLVALLVVFFISDLYPHKKSSNLVNQTETATDGNIYRASNTNEDCARQYS